MLLSHGDFVKKGAPCIDFMVGKVRSKLAELFNAWNAEQADDVNCRTFFLVTSPHEVLDELAAPKSQKGDQMYLALFLAAHDILLAVVQAATIKPDTVADDEVFGQYRQFVKWPPKFIVCAVLVGEDAKSFHYDLAVVKCPTNGWRALFSLAEWPSCRDAILAYLKKGPVLTSRWTPLSPAGATSAT
jgi:hypothetical protein